MVRYVWFLFLSYFHKVPKLLFFLLLSLLHFVSGSIPRCHSDWWVNSLHSFHSHQVVTGKYSQKPQDPAHWLDPFGQLSFAWLLYLVSGTICHLMRTRAGKELPDLASRNQAHPCSQDALASVFLAVETHLVQEETEMSRDHEPFTNPAMGRPRLSLHFLMIENVTISLAWPASLLIPLLCLPCCGALKGLDHGRGQQVGSRSGPSRCSCPCTGIRELFMGHCAVSSPRYMTELESLFPIILSIIPARR